MGRYSLGQLFLTGSITSGRIGPRACPSVCQEEGKDKGCPGEEKEEGKYRNQIDQGCRHKVIGFLDWLDPIASEPVEEREEDMSSLVVGFVTRMHNCAESA